MKSTFLPWRKWQRTIELAGVQLNIQRILWMIAMQSLSMVLFVQALKSPTGVADVEITDAMGELALNIKDVIVKHTKRDWRDNVIVHRDIKKALDDLLFDYMEDNQLDWSLDTIDIIIDEIMMVAKKGY